jgi:hypothetical protein
MGGANGKGKKKSSRDGKPGGKNANYKKTMKGGEEEEEEILLMEQQNHQLRAH